MADAVSSRTAANHKAALSRLQGAGAHLVTTEMVLYEWLEAAGSAEFRAIAKLIK